MMSPNVLRSYDYPKYQIDRMHGWIKEMEKSGSRSMHWRQVGVGWILTKTVFQVDIEEIECCKHEVSTISKMH